VQNGAASTLFAGPGNRTFLFVCVLKQKLQGVDVSGEEELKSEIPTVFQGIPSNTLTQLSGHWTKKSHWFAANTGNDYPSWP
jgi:hypothetical protein